MVVVFSDELLGGWMGKGPPWSSVGRCAWPLLEMKEGMEKVCGKQSWFHLLCMMGEKNPFQWDFYKPTLASWVWKNKDNK